MKQYIGARFDQLAASNPGAAKAGPTNSRGSSARLLRPVPNRGPLPAATRLRLLCPALDVFFSAVDACAQELSGQVPVVTHVVTYERVEPEDGSSSSRRRPVRRVVPPSRWLFWHLSRLGQRRPCRQDRRRKTSQQQWQAYERW